jgi:hypothetical protein
VQPGDVPRDLRDIVAPAAGREMMASRQPCATLGRADVARR